MRTLGFKTTPHADRNHRDLSTSQTFYLRRLLTVSLALLAIVAISPPVLRAACGPSANARAGIVLPPALQQQLPTQSASAVAASPSLESLPAITGFWFVNFYSGGKIWDQGFDEWHSDGTEILNDNAFPPSAGDVCLGVWAEIGHNTFKLKHPAWNFDANNNFIGTNFLYETVTIDDDHDSYRGYFVFDTYDLSGKLTSRTTGTLKAHRMRAD
jgi:hypothetical protein